MRPATVLPTLFGAIRHGGNPGTCSVCEGPTLFLRTGSWDRDQYRCVRCRSIPRFRALAILLAERAPDWRSLRIHESSPDGALSAKLAREAPGYEHSQFFPGKPLGSLVEGVRNEDLRALTLPTGSLDLFITQDVLEHVPDPDSVFREIHRVLRPGGLHLFTVPCHEAATRERARLREDGSVEHLLPPEYHGNPVDPNGSLVVTDWGRDLPDRIESACGMRTERRDFHDRRRGLSGAFLSVFVSAKHA